jgi:phospholipase D1/2
VDNHFACIGGLDLCFGRWDTHTHPLADVHPTNFSLTLFPGQVRRLMMLRRHFLLTEVVVVVVFLA